MIAAFLGESLQYVIVCEKQPLCTATTLQVALFLLFSSYYCFNLDYPVPAKHVLSFMQDYVLGHPDSNKKTATYLATVSDIKRHM